MATYSVKANMVEGRFSSINLEFPLVYYILQSWKRSVSVCARRILVEIDHPPALDS